QLRQPSGQVDHRQPQLTPDPLDANPKRERGTGRAICLNAQGELILVRLSPAGLIEDSRAKIIGETWAHPAYAGNHCFARDDERIVCVRIASPGDQAEAGR
ncbi:MAG TPA: hypothetical protein VFV87_12215, partial [Pirellulaceae bacterium]|nr:hypothetical protein [Pirellulaceae bacterium]